MEEKNRSKSVPEKASEEEKIKRPTSQPYLYDFAENDSISESSEDEKKEYTAEVKIKDPDSPDEHGVTLLMKAAKAGNDWDVKNLLLNGADVGRRDEDGWTALMYAVRYQNNLQIVKTLIEHGAITRVRNKYNTTPLLMAAEYTQNPAILELLLENRSGTEDEVFRAFMLTLSSTQGSMRIKETKIQLFLENMSIPINRIYRGKTALMHACQYATSTEIIKLLLDYGAKSSIRDADGKTAFDYAKENKNLSHDEIYWGLNSGN